MKGYMVIKKQRASSAVEVCYDNINSQESADRFLHTVHMTDRPYSCASVYIDTQANFKTDRYIICSKITRNCPCDVLQQEFIFERGASVAVCPKCRAHYREYEIQESTETNVRPV